ERSLSVRTAADASFKPPPFLRLLSIKFIVVPLYSLPVYIDTDSLPCRKADILGTVHIAVDCGQFQHSVRNIFLVITVSFQITGISVSVGIPDLGKYVSQPVRRHAEFSRAPCIMEQ